MKNLFLTFLLVTASTVSYAGLYECLKDGSGIKLAEEQPKRIGLKKNDTPPLNKLKNFRAEDSKLKPFLVYYAVDSAEQFMQLTVKFELAQLRVSCEKNGNVNFVAFLNSMYVHENKFVICKDKHFDEIDLATHKELNEKLKLKRHHLTQGDHTTGEFGPMTYLVQYEKNTNEAFGKFPLSHPDFVYDLLKLVITEEKYFPAHSYMPFLNLKSHGSKDNVLSGLQSCQENAKVESQKKVVESILSAEAIEELNQGNFHSRLSRINDILTELSLGSTVGVGDDTNLGHTTIGHTNLGIASGLGDAEGLGAEFAFGLYHSGLTSILSNLFNEETKRYLGFIMLESCDTNRDYRFHHTFLDNVLGTYSAEHSLWYRNLNWWSLLEEANGSSLRLVELLNLHTAEIKNIIFEVSQ